MTAPKQKPPVDEATETAPKKGKSAYTLEYEKAVTELTTAKAAFKINAANEAIKKVAVLIKKVEALGEFNTYRAALLKNQKK